MNEILFLYNRQDEIAITGGQKYEKFLFDTLNLNDRLSVERHYINKIKTWLDKLFAPLTNLSQLSYAKKFDIVIFNSSECCYLLLLSWVVHFLYRKKIWIIHHHFIYLDFSGAKRIFYHFVEWLFLCSADRLIIPSPYIRDCCKQRFPRKSILFWEIPFDRCAKELKSNPHKGQLLYIGTIEHRKGLIYLLEALRELNQAEFYYPLTIVGKTVNRSYRQLLDEKIATYQLDVRFTGYLTTEQKNQIIAESDVFVFPSLLEGYGMVLCETMMFGLPVICFDNSAMPYTVTNQKNGILVENKNVQQLANAIRTIVEDRQLRNRLSKGAKTYVSKLPSHEIFRQHIHAELSDLLKVDLDSQKY